MRVLQINSVCGIGSTGRIATDIHKILIENGHESYIAYGRDEPKNCDTTIKIGTKYDNYSHVAVTRIYDKHGFGSKKATEEFIKKIEVLDPDVIHLHNIHGYYINIEILFNYLKKADKPVIWTLHDCWAFTGHCAYFDFVGCVKWKSGCFDCPEKKSYPASIAKDNSENNFFNKKDIFNGVNNLTIVTPSKWLANLVNDSFLSKYTVEVINNGIDLDIFQPTESDFRQKYNLENKFVILGVASTWDRRKGFKYFIQLSNELESDAVIVLVGLSEKQKKELPKNIIGITRTDSIEALAKIYTTADVFVNPTLEEVMGLTNVEAMACGTPVITFNTGGSIECIDEKTGIIVEKGNSIKLRKVIGEIKKVEKAFYSEACIYRANTLFDKNDRYLEYLNTYQNSSTIELK